MSKSPAKLLSEAKNAAGDRAVDAARRVDYTDARAWRAIAVEIDRVLRDAIAAEASRGANSQAGPDA